jgi:hypothetical protein
VLVCVTVNSPFQKVAVWVVPDGSANVAWIRPLVASTTEPIGNCWLSVLTSTKAEEPGSFTRTVPVV